MVFAFRICARVFTEKCRLGREMIIVWEYIICIGFFTKMCRLGEMTIMCAEGFSVQACKVRGSRKARGGAEYGKQDPLKQTQSAEQILKTTGNTLPLF